MEVTGYSTFQLFTCMISLVKTFFLKLVNNFRHKLMKVDSTKGEYCRSKEDDNNDNNSDDNSDNIINLMKELPWKDGLLYILIYKQGKCL